MADSRHSVFFELRDALEQPGCAICTLAVKTLNRYFTGLGYEKVNDRGIRDDLRAARGFCAVHGQMLREARMALGTAIIHRDILNTLQKSLPQGVRREGLFAKLFGSEKAPANPLAPQAPCPACVERRAVERSYLQFLAQQLVSGELQPNFAASDGLCLPHFRSALKLIEDENAAARLCADQSAIWGNLIGELDEFIRKNDHQFAHEEMGSERDVWARVSILVAGHPLLGRAHEE